MDPRIIALIPAAGSSKDSFGNESSYPACLRYINGHPIIYSIVKELLDYGISDVAIGVNPNYLKLIENSLLSFSNMNISVVPIENSQNELMTIRALLATSANFDSVLVNFGDTYCQFDYSALLDSKVALIYGDREELVRWSAVKISDKNEVLEYFSIGEDLPQGELHAVSGVFWWKYIDDLLFGLKSNVTSVADLFKMNSWAVTAISNQSWTDSDHKDVFEKARSLGIQARHFNNIEIDVLHGTLTKRSTNVSKLKAEISYYENLPKNLSTLFPRMVDSRISKGLAEQILEYHPMRTLSEIYTQENVPAFVWRRIFSTLHEITYSLFPTRQQKSFEVNPVDFFINKVKDRVVELTGKGSFDGTLLKATEIRINHENYNGLEWILEQSRKKLSSLQTSEAIVHGDFCFSNILCDVDTGIFKLIDPRGGFENESIFGPRIYDIAKLAHSVLGKYDFLIAGQYALAGSNLDYELVVAEPQNYEEVVSLFVEFYLKSDLDVNTVRLLSALILLSIPVMHLDDPDRATAIFLTGIKEANNAIGGFA